MALCQDPERFSILFYSDIAQNDKNLYAFYQPMINSLVDTVDITNIQVNVANLTPRLITDILRSPDNSCSRFTVFVDDSINSFTYYSLGQQVTVYLSQTAQYEQYDETSEQNVTVTETNLLYEADPLTCTFGYANPDYILEQEVYCSELEPYEEIVIPDPPAPTDDPVVPVDPEDSVDGSEDTDPPIPGPPDDVEKPDIVKPDAAGPDDDESEEGMDDDLIGDEDDKSSGEEDKDSGVTPDTPDQPIEDDNGGNPNNIYITQESEG